MKQSKSHPSFRSTAPLDAERERMLIRWAQGGADRAFEELARAHHHRIVKTARSFSWMRVSMQDLVQEGYMGLLIAVRAFDPSRGVRLWTYARSWVRARIAQFSARNHRMVPETTSRAYRRLAPNLRRVERELSQRGGEAPSVEDIAQELGLKVEDVKRLRGSFGQRDVVYDDFLHGALSLSPEWDEGEARAAMVDVHARAALVRRALERLSERERSIVEKRHASVSGATLAELSKVHGVSRERIRQIESRALSKLRAALAEGEARGAKHSVRRLATGASAHV